jgi:hypothetical protein
MLQVSLKQTFGAAKEENKRCWRSCAYRFFCSIRREPDHYFLRAFEKLRTIREGWRDPFAGMTSREVLDELRGPIELPAAGQIHEK